MTVTTTYEVRTLRGRLWRTAHHGPDAHHAVLQAQDLVARGDYEEVRVVEERRNRAPAPVRERVIFRFRGPGPSGSAHRTGTVPAPPRPAPSRWSFRRLFRA